MRSLRQDFVYGLRSFSRSPGFALIFVLSLAVGIGAATSVFTLLNTLVLRPLPLPHPEQLVQVTSIYRNHARIPISFPMFSELERSQRVFSGICGWTSAVDFNVEIDGKMALSEVRSVTANYYSVLDTRPFLGRLINASDVQGGQIAQVAVISYEVWNRRFAADPAIVGKVIRINGKTFTIIGVTQKWFTGMTIGSAPGITVPAGAGQLFDLQNRSQLWLFVTGRLGSVATIQHAQTQLQSFWPHLLEATVPTESVGQRRQSFLSMGLELEPASTGADAGSSGDFRSKVKRPLYLLLGIVALILLVVCVNLSSLTLARASYRRQEISTRIALGASPWQAVRQFFIETLSLSAAGAVLALFFSYWGSRLLVVLITQDDTTPILLDVRPDWRVFCFAAATAVVTGAFIGLIPAWQLSRQSPSAVLRQNDRTVGRGTGVFGKALIVSQVAISLILLQAAGLFLRSLQSLKSFDPGFEKVGVTEAHLTPLPRGYEGVEMGGYRRQLADAITNLTSVQSVAFSSVPIPAGTDGGWRETVSLQSDPNPVDATTGTLAGVSPGFFKTLAIPLIAGRDFAWTDDKHHPAVVIIDSLLAKQLFPSGDPIGKRIRFGVQPDLQDLQIVGVSQSARILDVRDATAAVLYVPAHQLRGFAEGGTLLVRGQTGPENSKVLEAEIQSFGHEYVSATSTLEERSQRSLVYEQMTATLSTFFAVIALLVAGFGLFGLMSYAVNLRTREIGIRMAMGSQRGGILRLILRESVSVTLVGIAIGLPCALVASRMIAHMLFALSFADPVTLASASVVLFLTGTVAGLLPAIRAMKLHPMTALRHE
jgi:predicted permease